MACVQYRSALCRRQEPIANRTPTQIFLNQPFGFTRRHRWPSRPPLRPTPGPRHCRLPPPTCSPALGPVSPPSRCAAAGRARGGAPADAGEAAGGAGGVGGGGGEEGIDARRLARQVLPEDRPLQLLRGHTFRRGRKRARVLGTAGSWAR